MNRVKRKLSEFVAVEVLRNNGPKNVKQTDQSLWMDLGFVCGYFSACDQVTTLSWDKVWVRFS